MRDKSHSHERRASFVRVRHESSVREIFLIHVTNTRYSYERLASFI